MPDIDWIDVEIDHSVVIEAPQPLKRAYVSGPPCVEVHRVGVPDTVVITGEQACETLLVLVMRKGTAVQFHATPRVREAQIAESEPASKDPESPQTDWLALTSGSMLVIETPAPFAYTFVADPTVAEVLPATPRTVVLRALNVGDTDFVIGLPGNEPTRFEVTVDPPKITDTARILRSGERIGLDVPSDAWKALSGDPSVVSVSRRRGVWTATGRDAGFADVVVFFRDADPVHFSLVVADPNAPASQPRVLTP